MSPRSPILAFHPTPALESNHFSHMSGIHRQGSPDQRSNSYSKEVRFEHSTMFGSINGRHSIATSHVPLLPSVALSSHLPKQSFQIMNPMPGVDITAYFEHCRNVNEQQRQAYEQERKAWEIERMALKARIADLEFKWNKASGGRRRLSNDTSYATTGSNRYDFHVPSVSGINGVRHPIFTHAPLDQLKHEHSKPVWEPESPVPATRVFSHDDDVQHLPSISEHEPLLSPTRSHENKSIPVQQIDETLDGITVKSEGVKSSFNKVMSPIIIASPMRSPSPRQVLPDLSHLSLDSSASLDPLDAKLKRHAGHTPLAFDGVLSSNVSTVGEATPREEKPVAPAPTARPPLQPSERSDSYFNTDDLHAPVPETISKEEEAKEEPEPEPEPQHEASDDKPLAGLLMLDASGRSELSHSFLEQLDHKLEEEVRKSFSNSPNHSPSRSQQRTNLEDDTFPKLRMKKSTNFGSAYGFKMPGVCQRS